MHIMNVGLTGLHSTRETKYVLTSGLDEFGQWRPACNRFGKEYLDAYHKHVEKSAPEEDYDGRLDLYKL